MWTIKLTTQQMTDLLTALGTAQSCQQRAAKRFGGVEGLETYAAELSAEADACKALREHLYDTMGRVGAFSLREAA